MITKKKEKTLQKVGKTHCTCTGKVGKTHIILLDNFSTAELKKAVGLNNGQAKLEASGNVNRQTIRAIADTGVNFISCGQITKDIKAVDLSLQFST